MKPIDGHAMIRRVEALYKRGAVDLPYYNIVKEAVQMEPAVDAIPVEWMREKIDGYASRLRSRELDALVTVLTMWKKEQEAR